MLKSKLLKSVFIVLKTMIITGVSICSIANVACSISTEGIKLLQGDYESPVLKRFSVENSKTLGFVFSEKVSFSNCSISTVEDENSNPLTRIKDVSIQSIEEVNSEDNESNFKVVIDSDMVVGRNYIFYGVITDEKGNSLTLEVPFKGFNSRIAEIVMTEIQSASVGSQTKNEKELGIYRNEYVEFLCMKSGNLSGLELISGYDGEEKKYVFPSVEVKRNDIIVVHLRNRGCGCINEIGSNLNEAYSSYTNPKVRDLWSSEEGTVLGNKTDVIVLRNQFDGSIKDAVFYRDSNVESWSKDMERLAMLASEYGMYESYEPDFASITDGLTDTKTISRKDNGIISTYILNGLNCGRPKTDSETWIVTTATPGEL